MGAAEWLPWAPKYSHSLVDKVTGSEQKEAIKIAQTWQIRSEPMCERTDLALPSCEPHQAPGPHENPDPPANPSAGWALAHPSFLSSLPRNHRAVWPASNSHICHIPIFAGVDSGPNYCFELLKENAIWAACSLKHKWNISSLSYKVPLG